jgi:hypothetical protein
LEALRYGDIPLEYDEDGLQAAIAYLEWVLKPIPPDENFGASLHVESGRPKMDKARLRAGEAVGF